ncbi:chemotaxis protein CheW [Halorussus vallis]|nr:chemotaxis protein CheW [Halorussus vallis]
MYQAESIMEAQETDPDAGETAAETPVDATVETRQVVEFRLGEDYCAIDIGEVDSIVEIKKVTRIPRTPDSIDGVMDLRGETTAIINPRTFLGVDGEAPASEEQNVLVLDRPDDKQKIGIRVDEVLEVATYTEHQIDTDDDLSNLDTRGIEEQVSRGIIRKPDDDGELDLVVWVDVDVIIGELK